MEAETHLYTCTWFLVGHKLAMTNAHCIPKKFQDHHGPSYSCQTELIGKIKIGGVDEVFGCDYVVTSSKLKTQTISEPDFALIKLDRWEDYYDYYTLNVSNQGFDNDSTIKIHGTKIGDITPGDFYFDKYEYECETKKDALNGILDPKTSFVVPLFEKKNQYSRHGCKLKQGNSGSPIFLENGDVGGVASAIIPEMEPKNLPKNVDSELTRFLSLGTSFFCLDLPYLNHDKNINCQLTGLDDHDRNFKDKKETDYLKDYRKQLNDLKTKRNNESSSIFEYTVIDSENSYQRLLYQYEPKCVKPMRSWSDAEYAEFNDNKKIKGTYWTDMTVSYNVLIDYYGRVQTDVQLIKSNQENFKLKLSSGEDSFKIINQTGNSKRIDLCSN